jgi:hypothetical protein
MRAKKRSRPGQYGVALEHFPRAAEARPDDLACWLTIQAQFAIGKYDEAAALIVDAVRRNGDWPKSRFQSAAYMSIIGPRSRCIWTVCMMRWLSTE